MNRLHVLRSRAAGFSLIELLVAMVIALVVTLAISSVLIRGESSKRSTTSVNELNQTGAYAAFVIDRAVRSAGSGFSQSWNDIYGCRLDAKKAGTAVLPIPTPIPTTSAFTNVTQTVRMAPIIIGKGLADVPGQVRGDVLIVMGGTAGFGEVSHPVSPTSVTTSSLQLQNTLGYRPGDLVLLEDTAVLGGCMIQQVSTAVGQALTFAGTYYTATGTNVDLVNFGASSIALQLGNVTDNPPQFQMYAVGANNTLASYDLLQPTAPDVPIAEGIVEMRALYGIDTSVPRDGTVETWIDPIASSPFRASVLNDGSPASRANLRSIVAIRLGFILRTSLAERASDYQAPATTLTLFSDLPVALRQTRALSTAELNYRFRTVELTIPLRNVSLAP